MLAQSKHSNRITKHGQVCFSGYFLSNKKQVYTDGQVWDLWVVLKGWHGCLASHKLELCFVKFLLTHVVSGGCVIFPLCIFYSHHGLYNISIVYVLFPLWVVQYSHCVYSIPIMDCTKFPFYIFHSYHEFCYVYYDYVCICYSHWIYSIPIMGQYSNCIYVTGWAKTVCTTDYNHWMVYKLNAWKTRDLKFAKLRYNFRSSHL